MTNSHIHHITILKPSPQGSSERQMPQTPNQIPNTSLLALLISTPIAEIVSRHASTMRQRIFDGDMLGEIWIWKHEIITDEAGDRGVPGESRVVG